MLVEVSVHVGRVEDLRKTNNPGEDRCSVRIKSSAGPSRTVLATIYSLPVRGVHFAVNGGDLRASVWNRLDIVAAKKPTR